MDSRGHWFSEVRLGVSIAFIVAIKKYIFIDILIDKIESAVSSHVADNASVIDIHNVRFVAGDEAVHASADKYSLEDVITHILQNAQRYRPAESEITITLAATEAQATVTITNIDPVIDEALIDKIFEYGVSGADAKSGDATHAGNRGQGLCVAKTYMAKMGGTITASNTAEGVSFVLTLVRV